MSIATCHGVAEGEHSVRAAHILSCLKKGAQVAVLHKGCTYVVIYK